MNHARIRQFSQRIIDKRRPIENNPFDQKAAAVAAREKLSVVFMDGKNLKNFERFLQGKKFDGTIIG